MNHQAGDEKTSFQIERIAFFSDAVFAIAITLMVIEVKPPHLEEGANNIAVINGLLKMLTTFIGVVLSFVFIGIFWHRHHQLFKYVANYDSKLLKRNMILLLCIIFIPFSTAFNFELPLNKTVVPLVFYNVNYILATIANYSLFKYALNPKNNLCVGTTEIEEGRNNLFRELIFPVFVFLLVCVLAFVSPIYSPIGYAAFGLQGFFLKKENKVIPAT